jgi:hypothetical protein
MARLFHWDAHPKIFGNPLVSHSMGGLIGRRIYLSEHISRQSGSTPLRIRSIISIASPFQGANIAGLAQVLGLSRELVSDMDPSAHFLSDTAGQWSFLKTKPITYCFTSPQDRIVDQWSAKGQCECVFDYPQWGHTDMVKPEDTKDARYRNPIRALISALGADLDTLRKENHNFCF